VARAEKTSAKKKGANGSTPHPALRATLSRGERGQSPLSADELKRLYRAMLRIRTLDERMITLQRQGRVGFYGACTGQEAATIGSAFAFKDSDWIFPALREVGVMLMRGVPLVPYLAQVFGNSGDVTKGRQMPSHQMARAANYVSWSSVIGTQLPQAVGAAMAAKLQKHDTVIAAYMGDGATSSADFHVAMNFAGVFKAPVVFICQNNHWSISVPTHHQTASETIAIKAKAYGFPGVKVDGNDAEAVHAAVSEAVARARSGGGPTLVECETYRIGAHSTSDDPTRYRDPNEVEVWKKRDPIERIFNRMKERKLWSDAEDAALRNELLEEVNAAIKAAEALPNPPISTLFEDVYAELPWHLKEEQAQFVEAFERAQGKLGGSITGGGH
jgi:pyruvate dehydrogenase E1 component alpha subunit/2-oxoisovalerate dehydrogenase E1 component alpha subunit